MSTGKRSLETGDTPNKKPVIARQTSILSMFKPKPKPDAEDKTSVDSLNVADSKPPNPQSLLPVTDAETLELLDLEIKYLQYDWFKVLKDELTKPYFIKLKKFLKAENEAKKTVYPPAKEVYNWSQFTPPSKVKVVIIGQDPYHGPNQAHGLCFSVAKNVRTPPSLVNIYTCLVNDFPDFKKPNHGNLENWAKQGVLLLNASLTVRAGDAASHAGQGWEQFTDAVINYLNQKNAHIVFMLWGSHAQKKGARIDKKKHLVLKSVHPSPLSAHRGFLTCGHFKAANEYLYANGRDPVDWNCLDE